MFALVKKNAQNVASVANGQLKRVAVVGGTLVGIGSAMATDPVYTDPSTITSTATTVFNGVTVLVVAMVGFFIVVRIVKGIRK